MSTTIMPLPLIVKLLVVSLVQIGPVRAQSSSSSDLVACNPGWEWTYNSLGQTPCAVEKLMDAACADDCICNPTMYALTSACFACRDMVWGSWDDWFFDHNCVHPQLTLTIPGSTRVPQWAFVPLNLTTFTWNVTVAEAVGEFPESTAEALPSPTITFVSIPSVSSSSAPSDSHGLSRGAKAAIAGGVVGGVFALLGVLLVVNRRRTRAASAGFRERVRARYFDMKVGQQGLESVRMQEGPFNQAVAPPTEKTGPTAV
ncbi:hypothetical protein FA95DRAFT_1609694 [Auriscalpium vulgare]|uniref:Uncharacterized protein n=1 Tax=Auriscalpium vulgare TaxID=40419 RepID=A0ACB8RHJ7_9AGAM|nr:hypothetical protein FA95DRAFT_1609694 [Auriscalpium vulgare]